ncbi:LysR family transcriptional regulator [Xanthobacter dioxanivorans]|uniref:LysR family transcriptional regulator n=1 Tax=Xanthobacter dioxanivorans TaxID=2528964 RepID=A0A974PNY4_9HYPH|nr:LysR family transcriptional regulator [Xanthobacter dioxanivorans]QRG07050.1 LysR family transcriptional regulator [Xanthobacter dioxanivorans]
MAKALTRFDWTDLQTFLEVARGEGTAAAADALKIDTTTVRRRIAALEATIGARLLVRNGRTSQLTVDGERIFAIARRMEEQGNEIARDATDTARELSGVVRVSTMEGFGSSYLAARLGEFLKLHPNLTVQLVNAQHILNLSEREADISINMMNPRRGRLMVRRVGQFGVGLYGATAYLAQAGHPESLEDLKAHTFVTYVDELIAVPHVRWLPDVIEEPRTRFASTSLIAQQEAARAGVGLVMLPHFMGEADEGLVRLLPAQISLTRDWWLVVHQDLQSVPRIRALIDFIVDVMRRDHRILKH